MYHQRREAYGLKPTFLVMEWRERQAYMLKIKLILVFVFKMLHDYKLMTN